MYQVRDFPLLSWAFQICKFSRIRCYQVKIIVLLCAEIQRHIRIVMHWKNKAIVLRQHRNVRSSTTVSSLCIRCSGSSHSINYQGSQTFKEFPCTYRCFECWFYYQKENTVSKFKCIRSVKLLLAWAVHPRIVLWNAVNYFTKKLHADNIWNVSVHKWLIKVTSLAGILFSLMALRTHWLKTLQRATNHFHKQPANLNYL